MLKNDNLLEYYLMIQNYLSVKIRSKLTYDYLKFGYNFNNNFIFMDKIFTTLYSNKLIYLQSESNSFYYKYQPNYKNNQTIYDTLKLLNNSFIFIQNYHLYVKKVIIYKFSNLFYINKRYLDSLEIDSIKYLYFKTTNYTLIKCFINRFFSKSTNILPYVYLSEKERKENGYRISQVPKREIGKLKKPPPNPRDFKLSNSEKSTVINQLEDGERIIKRNRRQNSMVNLRSSKNYKSPVSTPKLLKRSLSNVSRGRRSDLWISTNPPNPLKISTNSEISENSDYRKNLNTNYQGYAIGKKEPKTFGSFNVKNKISRSQDTLDGSVDNLLSTVEVIRIQNLPAAYTLKTPLVRKYSLNKPSNVKKESRKNRVTYSTCDAICSPQQYKHVIDLNDHKNNNSSDIYDQISDFAHPRNESEDDGDEFINKYFSEKQMQHNIHELNISEKPAKSVNIIPKDEKILSHSRHKNSIIDYIKTNIFNSNPINKVNNNVFKKSVDKCKSDTDTTLVIDKISNKLYKTRLSISLSTLRKDRTDFDRINPLKRQKSEKFVFIKSSKKCDKKYSNIYKSESNVNILIKKCSNESSNSQKPNFSKTDLSNSDPHFGKPFRSIDNFCMSKVRSSMSPNKTSDSLEQKEIWESRQSNLSLRGI